MKVKKLLTIILTLAMIVTIVPTIKKAEPVVAAEEFAITSPEENALIGAGHFDIKWTPATSSSVKDYKLYIDDQLVTTTASTTYEYYTTEVKMNTAYVEAEYVNGETQRTDTVSFAVTKKGLAVNNEMGRYLNPLEMNMGWYYTWGKTPFMYTTYYEAEFVPMVWGSGDEDNELNEISKKDYAYLLAYNEPDYPMWDAYGNYIGGSDVKVETAINNWSKFIGKSKYLGAPAPALSPSWGTGNEGGAWFRNFMSKVDQSTIDFIPLHCYYGTYGGAEGANTFLKDVVDKTYEMYHKPIWITEFAVSGWGYNNVSARKSVEDFMYTVIDGLNQRDYVERYAWFSFDTTDSNNGASALWTNATGKLTDLGRIYKSYGNPKGYVPSKAKDRGFTFSSEKRTSLLNNSVTINNEVCEDYVSEPGVTATATSELSKAENAIDDNIGSRWESAHEIDPSSLTIDLGTIRQIRQIGIIWEDASAKDYTIEVSTDGNSYTQIAEITMEEHYNYKCDTITLSKVENARYVRIVGKLRATKYGYSIWDVAIYGTHNSKVDEESTTEFATDETTSKPAVPTTATPTTKKVTAPGKAEVKKINTKKRAAKKIKLTLKKIRGAKGYQVAVYKTKANAKKNKKAIVKKYVKKYKNITITSKKLKNKKKLYVKARAYKLKGKTKVCGKWSNMKQVKIKK